MGGREFSYKYSVLYKKRSLALSYFPDGLPQRYRRRDSVSQPSSGWGRSGSTMLETPSSGVYSHPQDCTKNNLNVSIYHCLIRLIKDKPSVC